MSKLGVIGAGSWGTALAIAAGRAGSEVVIWSRSNDIAQDINNNQRNSKYLGKILIHENVAANCDMAEALICDAILLAVPARSLRGICELIANCPKPDEESRRIKKTASSVSGALDASENIDGVLDVVYNELQKSPGGIAKAPLSTIKSSDRAINAGTPIVICAKGVEKGNLVLMSEVVSEYFPKNPIAVLSGPNFADEVAKGLPACATLACKDKKSADKVISMIGGKLLRLYYSDDVIGAQIGGAVKNVIAIAAGITIGKGLGENARAAIVTRGVAELGRLCTKMGGRQETLMGLSGIGDIMLTCASEKSRNMYLGVEIGNGKNIAEILAGGKTVEGVTTSKSVSMLAEKLGVDMPITNAVKAILHDGASIEKTIQTLLERPFASENT